MKFAIFCLAVALAALCAGVEAGPRLQKRSVDTTNPQSEANQPTSGQQVIRTYYLPGQPQGQPQQWPPNYYPPNYYPPQQPTTTTTADPMCPEGKNGPCRELPPGQLGSIQVRCDGLVTLQFFVEYKVRGQKIFKESRAFGITYKKTIDIPADAEDIVLTVQGVGLFGTTSDILKKQWKYPVIRCYSSIDAHNVNQVGCN